MVGCEKAEVCHLDCKIVLRMEISKKFTQNAQVLLIATAMYNLTIL